MTTADPAVDAAVVKKAAANKAAPKKKAAKKAASKKTAKRAPKKSQAPKSVQVMREQVKKIMAQPDPQTPGKKIGSAVGIYAYIDFDGEPIYVGQTSETFSTRNGRHLTGQRSDAVAKFILDPFEVAEIWMWSVPAVKAARNPKDQTKAAPTAMKRKMLEPYEYSVYKMLEKDSEFKAVLNEGAIAPSKAVKLPEPVKGYVIPKDSDLWNEHIHKDVRIARRAATIARLSQGISEREVSGGMRRTLLLQAKRLTWLAEQRIKELNAEQPDAEDFKIRAQEDKDGD